MPAARTPRRNGPYVPLSAFYGEDDAVIALEQAGNDMADLLYLRSLSYCGREPKLNGYISPAKLNSGRILNRPPAKLAKAAAALVEVGLWMTDDDGGWRIRTWPKWNMSHDEIVERQARDASRKSRGTVTDSAAVPPDFRQDSAPYCTALHVTTEQPTTEHGSSTLPPPLEDLQNAMSQAGLRVSWETDDTRLATIAEAVERCGVPALVRNASSRNQPGNPAFSVNAFVNGWGALPGKAPKIELVPDPCTHGFEHSSKCATCRYARAS
jgi:hypothetical protein